MAHFDISHRLFITVTETHLCEAWDWIRLKQDPAFNRNITH